MKLYMIEKLSEINFRMAVHEGNANARLASEARSIGLLPSSEIPERFRRDYAVLIEMINEEIKGLENSGLVLSRFTHIKNRTAIKYIKLLWDIERFIKG